MFLLIFRTLEYILIWTIYQSWLDIIYCRYEAQEKMSSNNKNANLVPGKWQMTSSENFDSFMAAVGVGYVTRKLGNASKPLVTIAEGDDKGKYSMKQESLVKVRNLEKKYVTRSNCKVILKLLFMSSLVEKVEMKRWFCYTKKL